MRHIADRAAHLEDPDHFVRTVRFTRTSGDAGPHPSTIALTRRDAAPTDETGLQEFVRIGRGRLA